MSLTQTPAHGSIALIPVTATNWQSISDALPAMAQQWAQLLNLRSTKSENDI